MKKGIIFYVTEGKEEVRERWDRLDLKEPQARLNANEVMLATTEDEIAYGWYRMITHGMQQIACMKAVFDAGSDRIEPFGAPLRLCG
ncbi:MAG: hypothetical protein AB9873_20855 [Syntrophobacteraceae bacterium]